ncbi:hypothetical protein BVY04_02990 [bacterium M21]|nr:hypothetical protein BVY04_02990 [bacterium M21]
MKFLLDTNTVSYALRGVGGVVDQLHALSPGDVAISSITEAELWFGVEKRKSEKLRRLVSAFLQPMTVLAFDGDCARIYGRLAADLEETGLPIGMAHTMIAAAMANDMILVTHNLKHFERIDGLQLADWY